MMNSVHSGFWPAGYFLFTTLHMLGALAVTIGFIFLIAWAVKKLHLDQLKRFGIILLITGALLCVVTFIGMSHGTMRGSDVMMKQRGMHGTMMMKHELPKEQDDTSDHANAEAMTMDEMVVDLDGRTGDQFDKAFLDGMIVHHQGAIDMAKAAQVFASHTEIKKMANDIISTQQAEIDTMKQWQKAWGFSQ